MPQLILLVVAGAGIYTGYKWISQGVAKATAAANRAEETLRRRTSATYSNTTNDGGPKDLGKLEWDEKAGLYRPKDIT